ncbi:MAG: amidohydrolase family protein, partial [Caulobacteraceae bacterium]
MRISILATLAALVAAPAFAAGRPPIIDMHLHASRVPAIPVPICTGDQPIVFPAIDPKQPIDPDRLMQCPRPLYSPKTNDALMRRSLDMLRAYNIRRGVISGPPSVLPKWLAAAPNRLISAIDFSGPDGPSVDELRRLHREKAFEVFAEVSTQYRGLEPGDPRLDTFWALAEELDIPVGIHMGEGMPGAHLQGPDPYRLRLGSPLLLDGVLSKHPKLRLYIMHYGSPFVDETIAMLFSHPTLYVDIAANDWNLPRAEFHEHLKRLINAGFEKRIMFGSDQTILPEGIPLAIQGVESAPFLSKAQKRDI